MTEDLALPISARRFIPHRPPMQLVDSLLEYADQGGVIEATVAPDSPLVDGDGSLDEVALVELLAQGYAVLKGYDDVLCGREISRGYLVGVKKLAVAGRAAAGDRLLVRIRTVGRFEGFAVADGEVEREGVVIAHGTIKLWITPVEPAGEVRA